MPSKSVWVKGYVGAPIGSGKLIPVSIEITDPEIIAQIKHNLVKNLSVANEYRPIVHSELKEIEDDD